jgi:DNA-binding MarR family transcriptional regulator
MTGLLDGLKTGNFIERVADSRDRRRIGVRLTPEGKQVLEKLLPDYYRNMAKLTAGLSENERQTVLTLLAKINQKLNLLFN